MKKDINIIRWHLIFICHLFYKICKILLKFAEHHARILNVNKIYQSYRCTSFLEECTFFMTFSRKYSGFDKQTVTGEWNFW